MGQGKVGAAVRGANFNPATAGIEALIDHHAEAKLVCVETQGAFLIANEDHDEVQGEIGRLLVEAEKVAVHPPR